MHRTLALLALGLVAIGVWMVVRDQLRGYSSTRGASIEHVTFHSALLKRDLHEIVVTPPGATRGRLLLVFLPGRGSAPSSNLHQQLFDTLQKLGSRAPVVLLADGGDHSDRWQASLVGEVIPDAVKRTQTHKVAIEGFGALAVARSAPQRFCDNSPSGRLGDLGSDVSACRRYS